MASVASQLLDEVTVHAQSDSLEDAREICADGTYFLNKLRTSPSNFYVIVMHLKQINDYGLRQLRYSYTDQIPVTIHNPHNNHI